MHKVPLANISSASLNLSTEIPLTCVVPSLSKVKVLQVSVDQISNLSNSFSFPGARRPSAEPLILPHSPGKASVLLLSFQEWMSPSWLMFFSPVNILSFPSAQLVPFLCNSFHSL